MGVAAVARWQARGQAVPSYEWRAGNDVFHPFAFGSLPSGRHPSSLGTA